MSLMSMIEDALSGRSSQVENGSPDREFRAYAAERGVELPAVLIADGRLHRFPTSKKRGDDSGWYILHSDGIPGGACGDWRAGIECTWRSGSAQLSPDELEAWRIRAEQLQRTRDHERAKRATRAANECSEIWATSSPAPEDHEYLRRKRIAPHGARVDAQGWLVLPLYSPHGEISSLQRIAPDGTKRYHSGGSVSGTYWAIGELRDAKRVYICEGYATAATVHEASGCPVIVAYSASNLPAVTGHVREWHSGDLCIVADHDTSGTGQRYAEQAAAKHGARYVLGSPERGEDANDYAARGGDLLALLEPVRPSWLVPVEEFISQAAPVPWLIKRWICERGVTALIGPSGSGKSFLAIDWAMSIATGRDRWAGRDVKSGPVIYLAGEGHYGMRSRMAAWMARRRKDDGFVSPPKLWISSSGAALDTPAGYILARDAILATDERPALIVVDTLARFMCGDENKTQDMSRMVNALDKLRDEFKSAVLLVHHTGVSEEAQKRGRGASSLKGALDGEILVVPGANKTHTIEQTKMKDSEALSPLMGTLAPQDCPGWTDEDGLPVSSLVWLPADDMLGELVGTSGSERAERALAAAFAGLGRPWISDEEAADYLRAHRVGLDELAWVRPTKARRDGCGWSKPEK